MRHNYDVSLARVLDLLCSLQGSCDIDAIHSPLRLAKEATDVCTYVVIGIETKDY
jgi:hypothetical protein